MSSRDRITPVDPVKAPPARLTGPGRAELDADKQRALRDHESAGRQARAKEAERRAQERSQTPRGVPVSPRDTLHDGYPGPSSAGPARSQSPAEGQAAVLLDEVTKARARIAELERDKRAAAEARVASFPPKVQDPAPVSGKTVELPISDAALGRGIRHLLRRFWPVLVGVAGIGAGGAGALKPAADPQKADATATRVTELERRADRADKRTTSVEDYARELARVNRCLRKQQAQVNRMITPAPDHMGTAKKPEPFVDDCPEDPKPP